MSSFVDQILGEIVVNRRRGSRYARIRLGTDGRFVATVPPLTPLIYIKQVVRSSRDDLLKLRDTDTHATTYRDGQMIGKHHTLRIVPTGMVSGATSKIERNYLLIYLPPARLVTDHSVQQLIRDGAAAVLRREAKRYLPDRLRALAARYDFHFERIRFSHASGRWGSCSSTGTISLNIALMKLSDELIDYVLLHELCHTRHMNHSPMFWREVERCDPKFRLHRRQIKRETPSV